MRIPRKLKKRYKKGELYWEHTFVFSVEGFVVKEKWKLVKDPKKFIFYQSNYNETLLKLDSLL